MKKSVVSGIVIILFATVALGIVYRKTSAAFQVSDGQTILPESRQQAVPTLLPTSEPVLVSSPTAEERVLPPVGSNAGLVIGAIVLVLIIIGGVLSARLRAKH